jgi:hypothetical protein
MQTTTSPLQHLTPTTVEILWAELDLLKLIALRGLCLADTNEAQCL